MSTLTAPDSLAVPMGMVCRSCGSSNLESFVDLGMSPLCESYVDAAQLAAMEAFFPLHAFLCRDCLLVQLDEFVPPEEIFTEYAYFSSYSDSWLAHARAYVAGIVARLALTDRSQVIEIASNDGYLLQYFVQRGIPALGVDPAANVARAAEERGVQTVVDFFGRRVAEDLVERGHAADLIVANNVMAHVPDLDDFLRGIRILLKPEGTATIEVPHLVRLIEENQFDTIYHEHFCYFSLASAEAALAARGLAVVDVDVLTTHGGSLRLHVRHADRSSPPSDTLVRVRHEEDAFGIRSVDTYRQFRSKVEATKRALLRFLCDRREAGDTVVGYGAPGKGNTLLNYCGIRTDLLAYTVDRNPYKQGKFLPGTRIPIHTPERIAETRPDYVLILPWNLADEIVVQLAGIQAWGGRCVVPIPEVRVLDWPTGVPQ